LILAMPEILYAPQMDTVFVNWQGRYWLPVVVGFPLVASTLQWRSRPPGHRRVDERWVAPILVLGLGLVLLAAQVASFTRALTRYEVGLGVAAASPTRWLPPGGHYPVVAAFVVGAAVTLALVVFVMMSPRMKVDPMSAPDLVGLGHLDHAGR
jgi:hypothetical protein